MVKELNITIEGHRDKLGGIEETSDQVITNYIVGDQTITIWMGER